MSVRGIDVSAAQGRAFDWALAAADGVKFAWCKATEGHGYIDPTYVRNAVECRAAGILQGAYHFFHCDTAAAIQADHYVRTMGDACDLPPVIDFESLHGTDPALAVERAIRFVERVEHLTGRTCVVYTYPSFWQTLGNPAAPELGARPLWIAHYRINPADGRVYRLSSPSVPRPWSTWACWQTSGNRGPRIPGMTVDVDRNEFNGDEADLLRFCDGHPATRDTDPAPPPAWDAPTKPGTPASKNRLRAVRPEEWAPQTDPHTVLPDLIPGGGWKGDT